MLKLIVQILSLGLIFCLEGFFPLFKDRKDRMGHAFNNVSVGALNGVMIYFLFSSLTVGSIQWAETRSFGLFRLVSLPRFSEGLFAFVLFDLWMYLWHFANHNVPFLWRFHRMHHSDLELDSTSALRFHTGEILLSSVVRLLVIPLLGMRFVHLFIYEACLGPVIIFHHSNIALPEKWDGKLRALIVTPNMHRIHHSREVFETNSNYSSIFSFWDRIVKTFKKREDTTTLSYGLPYFRQAKWQGFAGMLKTPFVNQAAASE